MRFGSDDVRSRTSMDHADIQRDSRSGKMARAQLLGLAIELEKFTRALLRLQSRVRGFSVDLDRKNTGAFATSLHSTTRRGRLHHKRTAHRLRLRRLLDERPS